MSRLTTMSPDAIRAIFSPEADSDLLFLLTIYDPDNSSIVVARLSDGYTQRISETSEEVLYGVLSNGENYKNHKRLFDAFGKFSYGKTNIELLVTISNNYSKLMSIIQKLKIKGVPVTNLGFLNKDDLQYVYSTVDIVLFPSFFESFGLGLIEAAQNNLPVLASNCDYVNEIIIPSKVFEPNNTVSLINALEFSYHNNLNPAKLIVENKINELLKILTTQ